MTSQALPFRSAAIIGGGAWGAALATLVGDAPCLSALQCADGLSCQGLTTGKVCIPGEETDGSDAPGLPGFLEPCEDHCAKTFVCGEGPVAGKCAPTLCAALPLRE